MLIRIATASLSGVEGYPVTVETDIHRGIPEFSIIGLADATIREAGKRVRPAIQNCGYAFPREKLTVNLMPAARPKEGSHFDLPIALSILLLTQGVQPPEEMAFLGELSLDGHVNPVRGVLPMAICLRRHGIRKLVVPWENREEAALLEDMTILPVHTLTEAADHVCGDGQIPMYKGRKQKTAPDPGMDYDQIIGQEAVKRALVIGAAGNHGILMMGSPGCGKTMMARRLPTILPSMTYEERQDVMGIYSVAGLLDEDRPVITRRPFRSPHHSITLTGLIGGGGRPRPGELSLAHRGVLFLDELGEFNHRVIDGLRQPIEEGCVRINRNLEEVTFPAEVMMVIAANPCKCGNLWDERKPCTCTSRQLESHRRKLIGPFADRIDMHIRVSPVEAEALASADGKSFGMSSHEMRRQVEAAREIQKERYEKEIWTCNGELGEDGLARYCALTEECRRIMTMAYKTMKLTMRGYVRVIKLARTIADLEGSERIGPDHVGEALMYRTIEELEEGYDG